MNNNDVIIDCYTDEPSGLGVPPFLGVHSRYIAGVLNKNNIKYKYLTIDDLRYLNGERHYKFSYNKRILNTTKNKNDVLNILKTSKNIYIVMGCFVKYDYVSAEPGAFTEIGNLLSDFDKPKILFYVLGKPKSVEVIPKNIFSKIVFGNTYNYFFNNSSNFRANYDYLSSISIYSSSILEQIERPLIMEIETSSGCNRIDGCTFCVENHKNLTLEFRKTEDILNEIYSLYSKGALYFRLGKQPNFFSYENRDPKKIEFLFRKIWELCPNIKTLHIDNANPSDVITKEGIQITKIISKYCTDANIASFGIETFDNKVREKCNINGTVNDVYEAITVINRYGKKIGRTGVPTILPGINLIYGLDGQRKITLDINLENLKKILKSNNFTGRTFVRAKTSPFGEQFDENYKLDKEFYRWSNEIENEFIIPMLKKIFPIGSIISELRMEMYKEGNSILRQMGTCPLRVVIKNKELKLDDFYKVRLVAYIENKTILGELI